MFKKMGAADWLRLLKNGACLLIGNLIVSMAIKYFYIPNDLMVGGATGVALILYRVLSVDTALTIFIMNLVLMIAGALVVGKQFLIYTAFSSMLYPLCLKALDLLTWTPPQVEDTMVRIACAGILAGLGIGLVIRGGGSTGGSDELGIIINKLTSLPVTTVITAFDIGVLVVSFLFIDVQSVIYSIITLVIEMMVMNRVLLIGQSQTQLFIVTGKPDEVRQALLTDANAGVTRIKIQTGYLGDETDALLCVIPKRKLHRTEECIHRIDPRAFITITEINEVQGNGFSYARTEMAAK
ncbi:MAG: YitT family protein [Oscillospiraceae bacterium]|nr:YitT family protein [Oscillospiraceae bacterium]